MTRSQRSRRRDKGLWKLPDGRRIVSRFVLGTDIKYCISLNSRKKKYHYTRLVHKIFSQRTYFDIQIILLLTETLPVLQLQRYSHLSELQRAVTALPPGGEVNGDVLLEERHVAVAVRTQEALVLADRLVEQLGDVLRWSAFSRRWFN